MFLGLKNALFPSFEVPKNTLFPLFWGKKIHFFQRIIGAVSHFFRVFWGKYLLGKGLEGGEEGGEGVGGGGDFFGRLEAGGVEAQHGLLVVGLALS